MPNYRIKLCDFYTKAENRKHGPFGALLLDWMSTTPLTNQAGFLEVAPEVMAFEAMIPVEEVERLLLLFAKDGRIMREGSLIWISEFCETQFPNLPAPTTIKRIMKELVKIGLDHRLVLAFDERYGPRWGSAWPQDFIVSPEKIRDRVHPSGKRPNSKNRLPYHE